jgi:hypothetical protein
MNRELQEREGKAKMMKKSPNMGVSDRQAMEEVQTMLRRIYLRRKLNRVLTVRIEKRKSLAGLRGTANYLQGVVRSYLQRKKVAIEIFRNVKLQKVCRMLKYSPSKR